MYVQSPAEIRPFNWERTFSSTQHPIGRLFKLDLPFSHWDWSSLRSLSFIACPLGGWMCLESQAFPARTGANLLKNVYEGKSNEKKHFAPRLLSVANLRTLAKPGQHLGKWAPGFFCAFIICRPFIVSFFAAFTAPAPNFWPSSHVSERNWGLGSEVIKVHESWARIQLHANSSLVIYFLISLVA